jgi:hypothetical protein
MRERRSRREFVGLTGAGLAGLAGAPWVGATGVAAAAAADAQDADLIVINAKIYTVDPGMPSAEAFAVRSGRFLAVGGTADIKGSPARARRRSMRRA